MKTLNPPLKLTAFQRTCFGYLMQVPAGRITTYKALAQAMGCKAYRAIGNALHHNPYAPEIPCHRVICTDGQLGGYAYGSKIKIHYLEQEGVSVVSGKVLEFEKRLFTSFSCQLADLPAALSCSSTHF